LGILYESNLLADLYHIEAPALFVTGSRDPTIRAESSRHAAERMPDAQVKVIDGAGHVPFISHPQEFRSIVCEFLGEARVGQA
jgi:pimeloyl-[acyl-carrier protein] methyl ester esterase